MKFFQRVLLNARLNQPTNPSLNISQYQKYNADDPSVIPEMISNRCFIVVHLCFH